MPVVFDLGAFGNGKAQPAEDVNDLVPNEGDRMMGAQGDGVARQAKIDGNGLFGCSGEVVLPILVFRFGQLFEFIQDLAEFLFLIGRHIFHFGKEALYDTLCAQEADAVSFQRFRAVGDDGGDLLFVLFDLI